MALFKVELTLVTEAETAEEALDIVGSGKWEWTVTNVETGESVEIYG